MMNYYELLPSPLLSKFIVRYYHVCGTTSEWQPYEEAALPNGYTSLVFHFEEKIKVSNVGYDGGGIPKFYLFGKYSTPIFVDHRFGKVDVFGVIFKLGFFKYFHSLPQKQITNKLFDVVDVFGCEAERMITEMYRRSTIEERKMIIEDFFIKRLAYKSIVPDVVDAALQYIIQNKGQLQVKAVCHRFNVSRQHLNRLFGERLGLSVKTISRIIRFNVALQGFNKPLQGDLLQVAVDFGYSDASHLIKEFHHFTGGKPSDFISKDNQLARFLLNR